MSLPILKACKKKKKAPKLFSLESFCDSWRKIKEIGAFRDSIRVFIQECAEIEDYNINTMRVWCTLLVQESRRIVLPLYTIEEHVKFSKDPFCNHCRCSGWGNHYLSRRKYHLIIPLDSEWNNPLSSDVLELQTHLLHGLIHCNGFGHLLSINGIEGGSRYLCGREIMELWDRICTNLNVRKISVEDTSTKRSIDLRLLHGITYGHSWFGKWGYRFSHGSFGVEAHHYQKALEVLSSLELDELAFNLPKTNKGAEVKRILCSYRNLSETHLITLRELLQFMLTLKSKSPAKSRIVLAQPAVPALPQSATLRNRISFKDKQPHSKAKLNKCRNFASLVASMDSRWPKRRLEFTAQVIVNTLKHNNNVNKSSTCGMTRQEVRDAARAHIGDTGLLDYVLKSMNNVLVGDHVVRRRINPVNRVLEYSIHKLGQLSPSPKKRQEEKQSYMPILTVHTSSEFDIYRDISILFKQLILDLPETEITGLSVRVILDSKHFIKEWPFNDANDQLLRFLCRALPISSDFERDISSNVSPGELIVLPLHASYCDLKEAAQHALRDTYCILENMVVTEIESLEILFDTEVIFGAVESGSEIWVRGRGIDLESEFKYEGGLDDWTIRCSCGASDDDGERMVSCDICEAWQHTRCIGIEDTEAVPPLFVCQKCCSLLMPPRTETIYFSEKDIPQNMMLFPELAEEPWRAIPY